MSRLHELSVRSAVIVLAAMLLAWFVVSTALGQADSELLRSMELSWRKREAASRTFEVTWQEKLVVIAGSLRPKHNRDGNWPATDVEQAIQHRLAVNGDKVCHVASGPSQNPMRDEFIDNQVRTYVFDGKQEVMISAVFEDYSSSRYPVAFPRTVSGSAPQLLSPKTSPILYTFRAGHKWMGLGGLENRYQLVKGAVVSRSSEANGRPCVIVEVQHATLMNRARFWLDSEREFVLCRQTVSVEGRPIYLLEVDYAENDMCGWVPTKWTTKSWNLGDGSPNGRSEATVASLSINATIPNSRFVYEPAAGTYERLHGEVDNIVKTDGSRRPVLPVDREQGATYEELLNSSPGTVGQDTNRVATTRMWLYVVGISLTGLAMVVFWVWQRRRHR